MRVIGLTGSIAAGKSFVASIMRRAAIPVFDADYEIHQLLSTHSEVIEKISQLFPEVCHNRIIDRNKLATIVFYNNTLLQQLENVLYPYLEKQLVLFKQQAIAQGHSIVCIEAPLLIEKGWHHYCDDIVIVITPFIVQLWRALQRPHMTVKRFLKIKSLQLSFWQQIKHADYIILSGLGKYLTILQVNLILKKVTHGKATNCS